MRAIRSHRRLRWDNRAIAALVGVAAIGALLKVKVGAAGPTIDIDVYLLAGRAFAHGGGIYQLGFGRDLAVPLPYTYPPLLAGLSSLVAWMPWHLVGWVWTAVNLVLLVWIVRVSYRPLLDRLGPRPALALALLIAGMAATTPISDVLYLGQVGIALTVLCLADTLPEHPLVPRGLMVGLATALKLTPAAFIGYWVAIGKWRAAFFASLTALALWLASAAFRPDLSREYWTKVVFDTKRVGGVSYYNNQSLNGVLHRAGLGSPIIWALLAALVMTIAFVRARDAHRNGEELTAVTLIGLGTLLASPVSWTHHAVWIIPASGLVLGDGRDRRRLAWWSLVIVLLCLRLPEVGDIVSRSSALRIPGNVIEDAYAAIFLGLLLWLPTGRKTDAASDATAHAVGAASR